MGFTRRWAAVEGPVAIRAPAAEPSATNRMRLAPERKSQEEMDAA